MEPNEDETAPPELAPTFGRAAVTGTVLLLRGDQLGCVSDNRDDKRSSDPGPGARSAWGPPAAVLESREPDVADRDMLGASNSAAEVDRPDEIDSTSAVTDESE